MIHFINFLFPEDPSEKAAIKSIRSSPVLLREWQLRASGVKHLDRVLAFTDYDASPLLQKAIYRMKYRRSREIAAVLGRLLASVASDFVTADAVLSAVPLHWARLFSRGFNQSQLIAREVSQQRGVTVASLLRRTRATGTQTKRKRAERFTAMKSAFALRSGKPLPEHVILIDDLFTTGATMDACAQVLKQAGVTHVEGLVLALG